jgi:hypothetical protein
MCCVAEPFDIDGDSRNTIIDAYKLAGIRTNGELLGHKKEAFLAFSDAIATSTVSKLTQDPTTISLLVSKAKQDLAMACETILVNQNPWVLNANLARDLEI